MKSIDEWNCIAGYTAGEADYFILRLYEPPAYLGYGDDYPGQLLAFDLAQIRQENIDYEPTGLSIKAVTLSFF